MADARKKPESVQAKPTEQPRVLKETDMASSEYAYARMSVKVPVGWTIEDVLKPEFWVRVAHKFAKTPVTNEPDKAGAIIEVRTADHAFYAEVYVRAVQERGLIVQLIGEPVYLGLQLVIPEGFNVRFNDAKRGYDILRKSDGVIVGDGFPTKESVQEWFEKTMKAA